MPDTEGSSLLDPIADVAEEAGDETRFGLPEAVRAHLGTLLGRTYDRIGQDADGATTPFADLLARLEIALAQAEGERDKTFRAGLLEVVPALHRFAVSLTRDPAAADDLVQDTLLRGWRGRGGFTPGPTWRRGCSRSSATSSTASTASRAARSPTPTATTPSG